MPKKGYKLTIDQRDRLRVTEKQFKNLIDFGAKNIKEKAFCSLMIDSLSRRQVAEHLKFEHIDWFKKTFTRFEKYNTGIKRRYVNGVREPQREYDKRREEKIEKDQKFGKIKLIRTKKGKKWKKIDNGMFSDRTKGLLMDLQEEFKNGYVFRESKKSTKSMSGTALSQMWERCVERHNRRIDELRIDKKYKIVHPDPSKKISLHDIRRTRPRNINPQNKHEFQTVQAMLGHSSFKTTMDIYDRIGYDNQRKTANDLFFKDKEDEE